MQNNRLRYSALYMNIRACRLCYNNECISSIQTYTMIYTSPYNQAQWQFISFGINLALLYKSILINSGIRASGLTCKTLFHSPIEICSQLSHSNDM